MSNGRQMRMAVSGFRNSQGRLEIDGKEHDGWPHRMTVRGDNFFYLKQEGDPTYKGTNINVVGHYYNDTLYLESLTDPSRPKMTPPFNLS